MLREVFLVALSATTTSHLPLISARILLRPPPFPLPCRLAVACPYPSTIARRYFKSGRDKNMISEVPKSLFELLWYTVQHTRYALVSAYTLFAYEWITTLPEEITQIHPMHWSSVKIAFLLCRYYPLVSFPIIMWAYIGEHIPTSCETIIYPVHVLFAPFLIFPQAVMLIRAYAFADKKPPILVILTVCFAGLVAVGIWVFCTNPPILPVEWYEASGIRGCFPDYGSDVMGLKIGMLQLAAITMDFLSLCVVIYHCRRELMNGSALGRFFIGQGLWAFAFVLVVNVVACVVYYIPNWTFNRFGLPFVSIMPNVVACRVILQLRRKADKASAAPRVIEQSFSITVLSTQASNALNDWLIGEEQQSPPLTS